MKTKQTKYTAYVTVYILIVLGVLGMINFLAQRYNKSFDSTTNKRFSLSDQTNKVVGGLKQDVKISYFDKPAQFQPARDILDRYQNLSPKLSVDYIDPDKKPQLAKAAGVASYGQIFIEAAGRKQEAKSLTEEELTSAIIRTLKGGERRVCAVTGSGEHGFDDTGRSGYSGFKELIEKNNYKTQTVNLLSGDIPKECTVVLVGGPKRDYIPLVVDKLKAFVEGGGRVLFLIDPPLKMGQEIDENDALVAQLAAWGVTANKDLALDTSGMGQLVGLSEVVPLVVTYEPHPIVRDMKDSATAFPVVRSLDVKNTDKTTVEKLFSTSENAFATTDLKASEVKRSDKDKKGPLNLGAAGVYKTGKEGKEGRFVVVGSSGFVANNILRFNGNRDLAMNMLNWLSSDEDLISIRPKEPEDRRITMTVRQKNLLFYFSVIMLPLLAVAAGLGVWWKRR
ncbi:MAG: GldG family protein [Bryobacteraceae bacterium]